MKRKILCIITTLAMLLSLFAGYSKVGYAKKSIDTGLVTFEDYEGNWTGTSGAKVPANTLAGSFSAYNGTSALHGITSAAPSGDSSNGVSVKMIHKPDSSAGTYSGLLHTFDSSNRVYNTIRVQFSTYIEKSANDKYSSRVLRFYGPQKTSTSSTAVSTVSFGNGTGGGKITAGGQTLTDWVPDTWYDVDVIYNFITKEYKVTVSDGKKDYSTAGVMTSAGDMLYPNRLEFFSPYTSKKLASDGIGEQVTYWDNIRAFEDWRYTLPSGDGTNLGDCFDFEDLEVTGDVSKTTQTGDKGSQWSVTLNDTNQYGVTPYVVKESETDDNKMLKLVANPSQTYGQFTYQPKRSISDTLYFKGTIRIDENLGTFNVYVHKHLWCAINIRNGYVHALGDNTADNRLIPYEIGKPFDFEIKIDMKSGYYEISATDGVNSGAKTGYYYQELPGTITYKDVSVSSFLFRFIGKADKTKSASVTLDNIQGGNLPEMNRELSFDYDFSGSKIPAFFVDGEAKQTALSLNEGKLQPANGNSVTYRFPFKGKSFSYGMDISVPDFETARKISVWESNSSTAQSYVYEDILTIGKDGILTDVKSGKALNENALTPGDYRFEAKYLIDSKKLEYTFKSKTDETLSFASSFTAANVLSGFGVFQDALSDETAVSSAFIDNVSLQTFTVNPFGLDIRNSVTGKDIKVPVDGEVYARFTNSIDFDALSEDSFDMPYNKDVSFTYEKMDDKTVKFIFDKEKSTHYHINMYVTDIYGNSVSDYIEFDTEYNLYEASPVVFSDGVTDGIVTMKTGDVTASVSYMSGDGEGRDALMWAALFSSDGRLCDAKVKNIKFTDAEKSESITINVPDDGKAYKLKSGIFTDKMKPVTYGEVATKIVIFKLDDLAGEKSNAQKTYDLASWAKDNGVKVSFGLKVGTLEEKQGEDKSEVYRIIKDIDALGSAEIWCHGYTHIQTGTAETGYNAEFSAPLTEQIATLQKCVDLTYEKVGITLHSLGVPHNITSDDLTAALEQFPQFKTLICSGTKDRTGKTFVHLRQNTKFESGTGVLHPLETIKADYLQRTANWKYAIFQGHSPYWNEDSTQIFKDLTLWLKSEKAVSMTPTEYYYFMNM